MALFDNVSTLGDLIKQAFTAGPGALSPFVEQQPPMQVPAGSQPTVPQQPNGILNNPQADMQMPQEAAQAGGPGIMDRIGNAFAINKDNFGNRIANGLIAAGSLDPASAFAKLDAADEAGRIKYNNIAGTPYFWYYKPDGTMAVVDETNKPVQAGALQQYLLDKAQREMALFKEKETFKGNVQTNVAAQKEANKTGLEQAGEVGAAQGQANQLRAIAAELGTTAGDKVPATGGIAGAVSTLPNVIAGVAMPQATKLRNEAERIIQGSLRSTLGGQFTEKEANRFLERSYNPSLPVADNVKGLNRLADELETLAKNKNAAVDYMKKNGTLDGFTPEATPTSGGKPAAQGLPQQQVEAAFAAAGIKHQYDPAYNYYYDSNGNLVREKK